MSKTRKRENSKLTRSRSTTVDANVNDVISSFDIGGNGSSSSSAAVKSALVVATFGCAAVVNDGVAMVDRRGGDRRGGDIVAKPDGAFVFNGSGGGNCATGASLTETTFVLIDSAGAAGSAKILIDDVGGGLVGVAALLVGVTALSDDGVFFGAKSKVMPDAGLTDEILCKQTVKK